MSPINRRGAFRLSAGALAAALVPVTTTTTATQTPGRTVGLYIDTDGITSLAEMGIYEVRRMADGSLALAMPYAETGVEIPNLTAAQLTDTAAKLTAT